MTKEMHELLMSREFNQKLGAALLQWAKDGQREAYEKIAKAGIGEALKTMANWNSTSLPLVYVRDFLEDLIDVRFNDGNRARLDAMGMDEFDVWCERSDEYCADKKKALIPRKGYQQWFLDKWFAAVNF